MLITKIERQKRHDQRVNVYVDDAFAFGVHEEILTKFRLKTGDRLSSQLIEEIESAEEFNLAKEKALRLVSYRLRSEKELRARLKEKEFHPVVVEKTIEHLRSAGIVDDNKFAHAFVSQFLMRKPAGRSLLRRELRARGITQETIQEVLQEECTDEQLLAREAANKILNRYRRTKSHIDPERRRQQIGNFLARRGFEWATIKSVLQSLSDNQPVEE